MDDLVDWDLEARLSTTQGLRAYVEEELAAVFSKPAPKWVLTRGLQVEKTGKTTRRWSVHSPAVDAGASEPEAGELLWRIELPSRHHSVPLYYEVVAFPEIRRILLSYDNHRSGRLGPVWFLRRGADLQFGHLTMRLGQGIRLRDLIRAVVDEEPPNYNWPS